MTQLSEYAELIAEEIPQTTFTSQSFTTTASGPPLNFFAPGRGFWTPFGDSGTWVFHPEEFFVEDESPDLIFPPSESSPCVGWYSKFSGLGPPPPRSLSLAANPFLPSLSPLISLGAGG